MMKKLFLGAVVVLLVLMVVAVVVVGFFLGTIVKTGMETVGPKITQVSIKVDAVNLSLLTGSARSKASSSAIRKVIKRRRPSASAPRPWA